MKRISQSGKQAFASSSCFPISFYTFNTDVSASHVYPFKRLLPGSLHLPRFNHLADRAHAAKSTNPATLTMRLPFSPPALNEPHGLHASPASEIKSTAISSANNTDQTDTSNVVQVSANLKRAIQQLYASHVTSSGVDYTAMAKSAEFQHYQIAAAQLPSLDIAKELVTDAQKIAFYVNLYNAMTQHAIIARGTPPSFSAARLLWGMRMSYIVANYRLSIHEVENGILRQNRRISVIPPPFGGSDPRRALCVQRIDPRIHFVLNCAATSCPPILFLTVENLETSLEMATKGFLANEENFRVDDDGHIYLSLIFKWYKADFGSDDSESNILSFVAQNGPKTNEHVTKLAQILADTEDTDQLPSIEWLAYNWSLNAA